MKEELFRRAKAKGRAKARAKGFDEEAVRVYAEAYAEAYVENYCEGVNEILIKITRSGRLSISEGAREAGMSEEEYRKLLEETDDGALIWV